MTRKCAFLTMDTLEGFMAYDYLLKDPLGERGWEVKEISWRNREADWNRYEAVIIRTPWDYQDDPELFMEVLEEIEQSRARLENPLELVRWNIDKGYLKDLEQTGIPVVPTFWGDEKQDLTLQHLKKYFNTFESEELIIKPLVSANADDTFRLSMEHLNGALETLKDTFENRVWLAQPFVWQVIEEGEFSLNYFGGEYSHALLKTPKEGDFRVQEEHGGRLKSVEPEPELRSLSDQIIQSLDPKPLYARTDIIRTDNGFALMELELIEPSLYFNMDPESPERFARIFDQWMEKY